METETPLFIANASQESIVKDYRNLISADSLTSKGLLKYALFQQFATSGHEVPWVMMGFVPERYTSSIMAFEDHLLTSDVLLKDLGNDPDAGHSISDHIKNCTRDISDRIVEYRDEKWVLFRYREIVAAFYSKELIILRFCWGPLVRHTWDVVVGTKSFEKGTANKFINYIEPFYKDEKVKLSTVGKTFPEGTRLTSEWANPQIVGKQKRVRIYDRRDK